MIFPEFTILKKKAAADTGTAAGTGGPDLNRQTVVTGNQNDGGIAVSFSNGDLEVRADFTPPSGRGVSLAYEQVVLALEKLNIVYGVRQDAISEAVLACNLDRKPVRNVLIAKGDAPVNEVAEYYEMNPLLIEKSRRPDEKARIDHRSYSPFVIVKKDQALAKLRFHKQGKEGKNVHGVPLPFEVIRPEGVSAGENTRIDGRLILAGINGQLVLEKKVLSVRDSLVIKGAVNYGTGNIIFPGDVVIEGPVSDGFKIYSGGSVTIKQTLDVTDVITKGDLVVSGGIIGRRPALVKSGGAIKTKFIENCHVAARKTITVDSEIINSSVFTLENIDLGEKGFILGGDIYAVRGIRAGGIGKKAGKPTRIHCGIDFTAQQEKEKNNNQMRILAAKLEKLRELYENSQPDSGQRARIEELIHRLTEEQKKAAAAVSDLLGRIVTDENASVEVQGEIVPGTLIEICQVALFVPEPLRKVRVRLDRAAGKVIAEPL
ncbi:MAG: FapA family protein [Treponema sp.]|jgi:uncharacterized protein (DUF342 family)|nr:FapA family protein [Treponema sp.]